MKKRLILMLLLAVMLVFALAVPASAATSVTSFTVEGYEGGYVLVKATVAGASYISGHPQVGQTGTFTYVDLVFNLSYSLSARTVRISSMGFSNSANTGALNGASSTWSYVSSISGIASSRTVTSLNAITARAMLGSEGPSNIHSGTTTHTLYVLTNDTTAGWQKGQVYNPNSPPVQPTPTPTPTPDTTPVPTPEPTDEPPPEPTPTDDSGGGDGDEFEEVTAPPDETVEAHRPFFETPFENYTVSEGLQLSILVILVLCVIISVGKGVFD